ncbi:hypothetical protein HY989_03875 [Candidatus Micrarchaeota archaeon]|nr:hypothetical protein [Candidatus Micrarchaeota archaeon]
MKKGIFFTLLFSLLLLLCLSAILFYIDHQKGENPSALKVSKYSTIANGISSDLLELGKISNMAIVRNSTHAIISLTSDLTPNEPPNYSIYGAFVEGEYAKKQNLAGKLVLTTSQNPFIYFDGISANFSFSNDSSKLEGSVAIDGYELHFYNLSEVLQSCGWTSSASGSLSVKITFDSLNCPSQIVSINPQIQNKFFLNTSSGKYLNITFGNVALFDNSFDLKIGNLNASYDLNISAQTSNPVSGKLSAKLEFVGDYTLQSLLVLQG